MAKSETLFDKNKRMVYTTDETRERILASSMEIFLKRGLFDTQMTDIAASVGISRSSLYRYYRDKVDLASAILERVLAEVNARAAECVSRSPAASGIEKLRLYYEAHFSMRSLAKHYRFMAEYDYFFSGSRIPADFRKKVFKAMRGKAGEIPEGYIEQGQLDGSVRADLDPHLAMVTSYDALRGLQQRLIMRENALVELRGNDRSEMIGEMIGYLMEAMRPRG
jgi:AcrR family transcriptional regulator